MDGESVSSSEGVYHVELRQFPHNFCHFNLTEQELRTGVLEPWVADRWFELGERKWNPQQAKLTVIESPRIPLGELSMGRGWRAAQREGREVTAQVLETVRAGLQAPSPAGAPPADRLADLDLLAGALGLELLAQIGSEPAPLRDAWELAAARHPGGAASEALAVAERAVASLLRGRLIVVLRVDLPAGVDPPPGGTGTPAGPGDASAGGVEGPAGAPRPVGEGETERILTAVESWVGEGEAAGVWMRRV
jgi:hypothetical protein